MNQKAFRLSIHENPPCETAYFEENGETYVKLRLSAYEAILKESRQKTRMLVFMAICFVSVTALSVYLMYEPPVQIRFVFPEPQ